MRALVNGISAGCLLLMLAIGVGAQAKKVALDDLLGDWLTRDYVEALKKTKSPLASLTMRYSNMTFTKEASWYKWIVGENFHSAVRFNNIDGLKPSGVVDTYALEFNKNQYHRTIPEEDDRIVYPDGSPDAIAWVGTYFGEMHRIQFVRVKPTLRAYVNQVVLAGEYTDAKGRRFVFNDDCKAEWPDKTFIYRIGIDHVLDKCDYLFIPTEKVGYMSAVYPFVWKGGNLIVYNVQFSEINKIADPERDILYVLTPVKK